MVDGLRLGCGGQFHAAILTIFPVADACVSCQKAAASDAFTVNSAASPGRTVNAFGCSKILTAGTTTSVPLEITGADPFSTSSVYAPASVVLTLPIRSTAPVPLAILSPLRFH